MTHLEPLLEMRAIGKSFPGVTALRSVDLTLRPGQVLALLGENGAGKSTLIKMLGGVHSPDQGEIRLAGKVVRFPSPATANAAGIGVIYQEFNLIPGLTAWENIFLGREPNSVWVQRGRERERARELLEQLGVTIPLDRPCRELSVAQQQLVEIAKTLSQDVRLIVMDEPSAALTPQEVERLLGIVRDLKQRGIGVIYISHRLDEIFEIADDVLVLRDGETVGEAPIAEMSRQRMIEMMVGREIQNEFPKVSHPVGDIRLQVKGLCRENAVREVSFDIHAGEVVGLTGLVGSGRTETARLIFGADKAVSGQVLLDGKILRIRGPRDAIAAGICLLTEDRKGQGLILGANVRENFGLPNLGEFSWWGFINQRREREALDAYTQQLRIRISGAEHPIAKLSGGNQQKVVLAKWLQRNTEVVIFDEPTRGVDVGAKYEIYLLINELARQGKAVLMISSELPEVLGMSDRVLVMHEGRITGEIQDVSTATQAQVIELAVA